MKRQPERAAVDGDLDEGEARDFALRDEAPVVIDDHPLPIAGGKWLVVELETARGDTSMRHCDAAAALDRVDVDAGDDGRASRGRRGHVAPGIRNRHCSPVVYSATAFIWASVMRLAIVAMILPLTSLPSLSAPRSPALNALSCAYEYSPY